MAISSMDANDLIGKQGSNKQPQLKKYFIATTVVLLLAILLGQLYQDFHRKQEHLDAKRISSHQQQLGVISELMKGLLLISTQDNQTPALIASTVNKLRNNVKQVAHVQEELAVDVESRSLFDDDELLAAQEKELALYVDSLLFVINDLITATEFKSFDGEIRLEKYQLCLSKYEYYQQETEQFIDKLSAYLEKESYEHRMVLWGVVIGIMILVILVGFTFYRFVSSIVNREFYHLAEENRLQQMSEQEAKEHGKLMLEQQMKMRSILDSTVDAIITITEKGNIDSFNKAAETMFGYPADFVIGKNVKMLMPDPFAIEHDGYLQNYQETREKKIIGIGREIVAKRIDGSEFPIHLSVSEVTESQPKLFTGIIRDITVRKKADKKLKQTMDELRVKQAQLKDEEEIARHVFENITASNNDALAELSSWCVPMGIFSGDLMLSSLLPSGGIRVLLCDFTGHGLPAALGAVPVSTIHKAMAEKGLPLDILMSELNSKLKALLPTGIFCCIAGVDIDAARTHAHIWNAGLPDIMIVSKEGDIKQRVKSDHLPLGVVEYDHNEIHCSDIRLEIGDMIYAYSDGLTEAENETGEMFGQDRFEQLLSEETNEDGRLVDIRNEVSNYMGKAKATDDISLVEIKTLS